MDDTVSQLLKDVRVAAPCSEKWDDMPGGDRVRSCARCRHHVYNLSEMAAADAARLIRESEGGLCVRFYRRPDGTLLTRDCSVGARAVQRRVARTVGVACASLLLWSGLGLRHKPRSQYPILLRTLLDRVDPPPPEAIMGDMAPAPLRPVVTFIMAEPQATPSTDKRFLRDLPVDNAPRNDPFAREGRAKR